MKQAKHVNVFRIRVRGQEPAGVAGIKIQRGSDLLQVSGADDCPRLVAGRIQGRQKHSGKDCNDRNYYEELY